MYVVQAEDGIRAAQGPRGLGGVYKRQSAFFSWRTRIGPELQKTHGPVAKFANGSSLMADRYEAPAVVAEDYAPAGVQLTAAHRAIPVSYTPRTPPTNRERSILIAAAPSPERDTEQCHTHTYQ